MTNSGYIYLDAGELDLTDSTEQEIDGLYDAAVAAIDTGKTVILTNAIHGDGYPVTPTPVSIHDSSDGIVMLFSIYSILIAEDDGVTVTDLTASET